MANGLVNVHFETFDGHGIYRNERVVVEKKRRGETMQLLFVNALSISAYVGQIAFPPH